VIYKITVDRSASELDFFIGTERQANFPTKCWWDPKKKIPAGTYAGCSTTRMSKKNDTGGTGKRHGVFIPDVPGYKGIFIHEGKSAAWSDGCIVCARARVVQIYEAVPLNGKNITVVVSG
jgi:hypothetical protein